MNAVSESGIYGTRDSNNNVGAATKGVVTELVAVTGTVRRRGMSREGQCLARPRTGRPGNRRYDLQFQVRELQTRRQVAHTKRGTVVRSSEETQMIKQEKGTPPRHLGLGIAREVCRTDS